MTPNAGAMICGRFAPPGTTVGVAPWPAYRSQLNFRDPDEFVPERLLGHPRYADDKMGVLQPFCIGPAELYWSNVSVPRSQAT
jgi:cytochrome P450